MGGAFQVQSPLLELPLSQDEVSEEEELSLTEQLAGVEGLASLPTLLAGHHDEGESDEEKPLSMVEPRVSLAALAGRAVPFTERMKKPTARREAAAARANDQVMAA